MRAIRHDVAVQGVLVVQVPGSCPLACLRLGDILRNTKSANFNQSCKDSSDKLPGIRSLHPAC